MRRLIFGQGHSLNFYCLLSSLLILIVSTLFKERFFAGLGLALACLIAPFLQGTIIRYRAGDKAGLGLILLSAYLCSSSYPLFENDHFRYLYEGKLLLAGVNPYKVAPASSALVTPLKHLIGYPHLASPYPFLALLYFSLLNMLFGPYALIGMSLFHAGLSWWLVNKISEDSLDFSGKGLAMAYLCYFLLKEYSYSLHFDILGFCFFYWAIQNRERVVRAGLALFLCTGFKLFGVIGALILGGEQMRKNSTRGPLFFLVSFQVVAVFLLWITGFFNSSGWISFSGQWWFSSGLGSIATLSGLEHQEYIKVWPFIFSILLIGLSFQTKLSAWQKCYGVFMALLFLSPVFNAWYGLWIFIPAFFMRNFYFRWCGLSYGILGGLSYLHHIGSDIASEWHQYLSILTHFPVLIILVLTWHHLKTNRRLKTS